MTAIVFACPVAAQEQGITALISYKGECRYGIHMGIDMTEGCQGGGLISQNAEGGLRGAFFLADAFGKGVNPVIFGSSGPAERFKEGIGFRINRLTAQNRTVPADGSCTIVSQGGRDAVHCSAYVNGQLNQFMIIGRVDKKTGELKVRR